MQEVIKKGARRMEKRSRKDKNAPGMKSQPAGKV
jgi:hypothetical protein